MLDVGSMGTSIALPVQTSMVMTPNRKHEHSAVGAGRRFWQALRQMDLIGVSFL